MAVAIKFHAAQLVGGQICALTTRIDSNWRSTFAGHRVRVAITAAPAEERSTSVATAVAQDPEPTSATTALAAAVNAARRKNEPAPSDATELRTIYAPA